MMAMLTPLSDAKGTAVLTNAFYSRRASVSISFKFRSARQEGSSFIPLPSTICRNLLRHKSDGKKAEPALRACSFKSLGKEFDRQPQDDKWKFGSYDNLFLADARSRCFHEIKQVAAGALGGCADDSQVDQRMPPADKWQTGGYPAGSANTGNQSANFRKLEDLSPLLLAPLLGLSLVSCSPAVALVNGGPDSLPVVQTQDVSAPLRGSVPETIHPSGQKFLQATHSLPSASPILEEMLGKIPESESNLSPTLPPIGGHVAAPWFQLAGAQEGATCEEPYGILPCSDSVGGNLFLMLAFGYILLQAAQLISNGSELLLEVLNPGLIGGLLLPILGSFPDALLVAVSGLGGTVAEAQEEVMVGVGVLAGSTIMILTVTWAASLLAGRCDLTGPNGTAVDRKLTRPLTDWAATGVTADQQTRRGATIMAASIAPFLVVQWPLVLGRPADGPEAALIGCAISAASLAVYCAYQVASPWLQQKRIEEARLRFFRSRQLAGMSRLSLSLAAQSQKGQRQEDGPLLERLFGAFDSNCDGKISRDELQTLMVALDAGVEGQVPEEGEMQTWLKEFDMDADSCLSLDEFKAGTANWMAAVTTKRAKKLQGSLGKEDPTFWAAQSEDAKRVLDLLAAENAVAEEEEGEGEEGGVVAMSPGAIYKRAILLTLSGAALVAMFADPMVNAIGDFSAASSVPPFFVAFVVTPFASNASELVSSVIFARKKQSRSISLTLSQLYGGVTMNNTMCLGIFLALVYMRGLTWNFSSEVVVILAVTLVMGALGSSRSTFPSWMAYPVLALYPLSIGGVAFLDSVLGWQ